MASCSLDLLTREAQFAAFATGSLLDFWHRRQEGEFNGVDDIPIRYARFTSPDHDRVIAIFPGRIESYVKYGEVAYDLFRQGYDVLILDHRGQGRSGRLLADRHRGHVERFSDYSEDVALFWRHCLAGSDYRRRFAVAHSMGGAILAQFLLQQPQTFDAAVLCAPMFGIHLPVPRWLAWRILDWAERRPAMRDYYAIGTGQWRPLPYSMNVLTHSRERYRRNVHFYADYPELRVGGPTYHWLREALLAGQRIIADAADLSTPLLILQAEDDRVVDNHSQALFCQARARAGHAGIAALQVIAGARHEILFEKDDIRAQAFDAIVHYLSRYH
ncbi:lysophospholipase L2 [Affinibrenneria salicis]|uniref:Lysophospholipase L2 n=1 Tax=Affinibrenneria salicis TaxID=2590031 RepID=A0A5J5FTQ3_9GAMM|nr:lysophospholipase L2 [Affinibrenneria salicis]KAA8996423.1 lysophospholipase L2 [Affinibrenneria salicis]